MIGVVAAERLVTMADLNQLVDPSKLPEMSRRDRKKQETRWRIYNAGILLFGKYGYDKVKIEEICEEADVSSALFFHHFKSKNALVHAFLDQVRSRIAVKLRDVPDSTAAEKLTVISQEIARLTGDTPGFTAQLLGALPYGEIKLDMEHLDVGLTGAISNIIREGQKSGEFSKDWSPDILTVLFLSNWLIIPMAAVSSDFPEKPHDKLLEFVLHGLASDSRC